ncbi:unnamed protein product [Didymodactylos carnosus]|uniref:Uncharacterized protein n=1 Tax=Didymodactylos carnosus TaxID=1234261 RepID=A0A814W2W3_9BILA|nr:unnamed protein product [Didymodactylos carnosus]CAF1198529.1 unnamed protein product [Didymodactylos carnosus]CAF3635594.1 unnamed protein product [Didymodactylos carnosus]CAF3963157.1 unnamed protein product [Didymodactylos carnosus]
MFVLFVFLLFIPNFIQTCELTFYKDDEQPLYYMYEGDKRQIDGSLNNCSKYLTIKTISTTNNLLKKMSVQNVNSTSDGTFINITVQAKLLGFANVTVHVYLERKNETVSIDENSLENHACRNSFPYKDDLLRNCPSLMYENGSYVLNKTIQIAVKRRQTIIDILFTTIVVVLVAIGTFCIGCGLLIEQLASNIRHPLPLLVGLFCQFVFAPLLGFGIARILKLDHPVSLGILSTASCPGGGMSSIYTALLGGDVDLSISMTFATTAAAFGTFPFWIWALGRTFIDFKLAKFPWWNMFLSLTTLLIPVLAGLLTRRYRPVMANRVGKFLNPIGVGFLVFVLTFGVYINMYIFYLVDFKMIMACCFLPWFGFIGGAILGLITTQDKKRAIAICIETGLQNTAASIFFLRLTFPQPESDIALTAPLVISMATPIPFILMLIAKSLYLKCCAKKKTNRKNVSLLQQKTLTETKKQHAKTSHIENDKKGPSDSSQIKNMVEENLPSSEPYPLLG